MFLRPELANLWGLRQTVLKILIWVQKGRFANIIANSNNLSSYKPHHALADYAKTIWLLGTTDGYSTQTVRLHLFFSFLLYLSIISPLQGELEHQRCKQFYPRVHKGKFVVGIGKQIRQERILQNAGKDWGLNVTRPSKKQKKSSCPNPDLRHPESLPAAPPQQHYQIADDIRNWVDISRFLGEHHGDPAVHVSFQLDFFIITKINGTNNEAIEFSARPQGLCPQSHPSKTLWWWRLCIFEQRPCFGFFRK